METKQTAVDWLYERLERMIPRTALYNIDKKIYFDKAKQMEREQIIESFMEGTKMHNINDELSARFNACIYYGEKFGEKFGGKDE